MSYIPRGADAYWHADDDYCPHCGLKIREDRIVKTAEARVGRNAA